MTLQQLKYIVALDQYRSFAKASSACNISQPTLSAMLMKLEEELDVRIFERNNKSVTPTASGVKLIGQAKRVLAEAEHITWLIDEEKGSVTGELSLSVGPTIAPYIVPNFIRHYVEDYPSVELRIQELKVDDMLAELSAGNLDAGIAVSGNVRQGILEVPLYTERFMVYISEGCWRKLPVFKPENLEHEKMWVMKDALCFRESAFSFCKAKGKGQRIYEAGSIETLIRIVDENGGFTIIPEMHLPFLSEQQRANIRPFAGESLSYRRVSIYFREDYIRQSMLNSIVQALGHVVPASMMEERVVKYGIKL